MREDDDGARRDLHDGERFTAREEGERAGDLPAKYLNRLSDLLFILARVANPDGDVLWTPGANR